MLYAACYELNLFNWYVVKAIDEYPANHDFVYEPKRIFVSVDGRLPMPVEGNFYNPDLDDFVDVIPQPYVRRKFDVTFPQFWNKFTTAERRRIGYLMEGTVPAGVTISEDNRIDLIWFVRFTENFDTINVQATKVQSIVDAMEAAGIIGVGRADVILER